MQQVEQAITRVNRSIRNQISVVHVTFLHEVSYHFLWLHLNSLYSENRRTTWMILSSRSSGCYSCQL